MKESMQRRVEAIEQLAKQKGLDFFPVVFEEVPREIIWDIASYGLPTRMSHWSFGRSFIHQKTYGEMGYGKIYELILNNNPSYAFLDDTNPDVINLLVAAHCLGHSDFFKKNACFSKTNRNMVNQAERNAKVIEEYKDKYGIDQVENWMDIAFALDRHIDWNLGEERQPYPEAEIRKREVHPLPYADLFGESSKPHVIEEIINTEFPPKPEKDLLWFLLTYSRMLPWQKEVFSIIRSESFYFYPQALTKIMNEGWACVDPSTLVFTNSGIRTMKQVVEEKISNVSDGDNNRIIYDQNIIRSQPTIKIKTRRGYSITGSVTHRILLPDGKTFRRLDEFVLGDKVKISGGAGAWPKNEVRLKWKCAVPFGLKDAAKLAGTSIDTIGRRRRGRKNIVRTEEVDAAIKIYESGPRINTRIRKIVRIPNKVDEKLGLFLGYLIGDGHISRVNRTIGLTTGDLQQAKIFYSLSRFLFGVKPSICKDENRYRVSFYSETVSDYLVQAIGLTTGFSARQKTIPDVILRSPEKVVKAFLRGYFDSDGYAGKQGIILSTSSNQLADRVQIVLLNWGILSRRQPQAHDIWNIHINGKSAVVFSEKVGFGLKRKQKALDKCIKEHSYFKKEDWEDEIISIEQGTGDVYDISVRDTHKYAAGGFVNHNSFWHAELMLEFQDISPDEHLDFSKGHAGVVSAGPKGSFNPYYVGFRIFSDIRKRWDKYYEEGQKDEAFKKTAEIDHRDEKGEIVMSKMTGLQRIFQIREEDDDISFIYNYLTKELCKDMELFTYGLAGASSNTEEDDIILKKRTVDDVKAVLTARLHNYGAPKIEVVKMQDGILYLTHDKAEKMPLDEHYTTETLRYIYEVWKKTVILNTYDRFGKDLVYKRDEGGVSKENSGEYGKEIDLRL